jgi:hypothetical protein
MRKKQEGDIKHSNTTVGKEGGEITSTDGSCGFCCLKTTVPFILLSYFLRANSIFLGSESVLVIRIIVMKWMVKNDLTLLSR